MATQPNSRPPNRKRQLADPSQDGLFSQPSKKVRSPPEDHHPEHPPPAFWDRLSKIWLTRRALRELDRRNAQRTSDQQSKVKRPRTRNAVRRSRLTAQALLSPSKYLSKASQADTTLIRAFARQGGPDLSDMRGYREPRDSSSQPSSKRRKSTDPTSGTKSKRSTTAYDRGFEQHLIDHHIYLNNRAQTPGNWEEINSRLAVPRDSLSPSIFSKTAFKAFQENDSQAKDEDDVMIDLIPVISGIDNGFSARKTSFKNLKAITDGTIVPANPDLYFGARPEKLVRQTRTKLSGYITPSPQEDKPMAPSFFLEAKGPDGAPSVAKRQACYDGALGARALHQLQSYGKKEPVFDNNAYTISSTYQDGYLKMYTTHPTEPADSQNSRAYHMSPLRSFAMTDNLATFLEGAAAFRNARDWAQEKRDEFISAANERVGYSNAGSSTLGQSFQGDRSDIDDYHEYESQTSVDAEFYTSQADPDTLNPTNIRLSGNSHFENAEEETSTDELALDMPTRLSQKQRRVDAKSNRKPGERSKRSRPSRQKE